MGIAAASAIVVGGVTVAMNIHKDGIVADADEIDARIHNAEMDARRAVLKEKIGIYDSINLYGSNLQTADVLYEYLPKGTTEVRTKLLEALEGLEESYLIEKIVISDYNVTVLLQTKVQEVPTKYVRNLIEQDYFEAITFTGFDGEEVEQEENARPAKDDEAEYKYGFNLTMRIKGGNNVELK